MSSPRVLSSKKNFAAVNTAWENYYSENKFAISADVQKALKYVPIYYQKKNLTAMAVAYSLWNGAEQRFEVFCPKNSVFRSTNLHELGHIYFGHLKNSRKYIAMAEKILKPYEKQIASFLGVCYYNAIHDIINVCMDFEINSKLFVTSKEREELNASVQFYLLRRHDTRSLKAIIESFNPENLSKETVIFFPENFGFPGKKSFLEYVQMMVDYCINHKKPETSQDEAGSSSQDNGTNGTAAFSLPDDNTGDTPKNDDAKSDSPFNEEDKNNSDKENKLPSFNENNSSDDKEATGDNSNNGADTPQIEDIDDDTFAKRFKINRDTEERRRRIKVEDSCSRKKPVYEINGETLDTEIDTSKNWIYNHEKEEEEIKDLKEKVEVAANASEINNFILNNALPSNDISSYNDMLYNYNRGKTTDVFINKVRTRSTFRKPNIRIFTDVSGSMDTDYTKKIVKAIKTISSRIDTRSSITFYNECAWNTEKLTTLNDEVINSSFIGGGTDLANSLKVYIKSQENNPANTLVIISDFEDCISTIKKSFDNIKSTILCIEVGNRNSSYIAEEFKSCGITKAKLIKIVNRHYAA